jgi:hypothetical protein
MSTPKAGLQIVSVLALYGAAYFAGFLGFGAAMSEPTSDPVTGTLIKPLAPIFGLWGMALLLSTLAGVIWLAPLLKRTPVAVTFGVGAIVLAATLWAWANIATFEPETERALTWPLFLGMTFGPPLIVVSALQLVRNERRA